MREPCLTLGTQETSLFLRPKYLEGNRNTCRRKKLAFAAFEKFFDLAKCGGAESGVRGTSATRYRDLPMRAAGST